MTRRTLLAASSAAAITAYAPRVRADTPIKLGTVAALEGPLANTGMDAHRQLQLLLEQIDYKAGGRPIEWIKESSNGQPDVALARARKLIEQDRVDIVLGPLSGAEGIAIRDYSRTVPNRTFVNGSSGAADTTLRNPSSNFFRFSMDGTQWVAGLGEHVKNVMKVDEVTVMASDYAFAYAQVFGFSLQYTKAGGRINYIWSPFGTSDYSSLISRIPASSGAIFAAYGGSDSLAFLTQYAQAGGALPLVGGTLLAEQTILAARGPHRRLLAGIVAAGPVADHYDNAVWKDYVARYQKRWSNAGGLQSPSGNGFSYATSLQAILLALKQVDGDLSGDQSSFRRALAKVEFRTNIDSHMKLDHNRQAVSDNFVYRIEERDGRLQGAVIRRVENVNQTLGIPEDKYMLLGSPSRTNPGNVMT